MSPFLLQIFGVLVRSALTSLTGYLVANQYLTADQSASFAREAFDQVMRYAPAALAVGWSIWQKYRNRLRLIAALELPAGAEEDEAKALATSPAIKRQLFDGVA